MVYFVNSKFLQDGKLAADVVYVSLVRDGGEIVWPSYWTVFLSVTDNNFHTVDYLFLNLVFGIIT